MKTLHRRLGALEGRTAQTRLVPVGNGAIMADPAALAIRTAEYGASAASAVYVVTGVQRSGEASM